MADTRRVRPEAPKGASEGVPGPSATESAALPVHKPEIKEASSSDHAVPQLKEDPAWTQDGSKTDESQGRVIATKEGDPILNFPRKINLNFKGIMYHFDRGPHRVPREMSDHWYLKHAGCKPWSA